MYLFDVNYADQLLAEITFNFEEKSRGRNPKIVLLSTELQDSRTAPYLAFEWSNAKVEKNNSDIPDVVYSVTAKLTMHSKPSNMTITRTISGGFSVSISHAPFPKSDFSTELKQTIMPEGTTIQEVLKMYGKKSYAKVHFNVMKCGALIGSKITNDIISSKIPVDAKHVMIDPDWNQTQLIFKLMFEEEL